MLTTSSGTGDKLDRLRSRKPSLYVVKSSINHTPPRFSFGPDTLNLENIYACPELIDFLVGYKGILEELSLRDYRSKLFTSPSPPAA